MDTTDVYNDFAFIAFALMGALLPMEQALSAAEGRLAASYRPELLAEAKQAVLDHIAGWARGQ